VANPKQVRRTAPANYPGKIRIIGGHWRGRKLPVLVEEGLRPTPDRVRETLFNWLAPIIEGARCLDLFSGTGALCLEALSRGASGVVMVERAKHVADQLRRNIATLAAADRATVIETDAIDYLRGTVAPFDVIFLDPPFASDFIARGSELIDKRGWLKPGGLIYVEAPAAMLPLPVPSHWTALKNKQAGQVGYHLLRMPVQ
jgi:16S rRNA (guanine966-N2)-methyltransferase